MQLVLLLLLASTISCAPVVFIQDAALDALVSYLLIQREANQGVSKFYGEIMINADGIAPCNMIMGGKLHRLVNASTPLTLSSARGYNAFPYAYRSDCLKPASFKSIKGLTPTVTQPYVNADLWLADQLQAATEPVDVLCVTGITTLALVLQYNPSLVSKVKSVTWMAGAVHVKGNLDKTQIPYNQYTSWNQWAEWNVFFDPFAVEWLFHNTNFPINLAPLDVSDSATLNADFFKELKAHNKTAVGHFLNEGYQSVKAEPFYRLWNTAAIATYYHPEFFQACVNTNLTIITDFKDQGRLATPSEAPKSTVWRNVCVYEKFATGGLEKLYNYIATLGDI